MKTIKYKTKNFFIFKSTCIRTFTIHMNPGLQTLNFQFHSFRSFLQIFIYKTTLLTYTFSFLKMNEMYGNESLEFGALYLPGLH